MFHGLVNMVLGCKLAADATFLVLGKEGFPLKYNLHFILNVPI